MTRHPLVIALLVAMVGLSACTSLSRVRQVVMDPSLPIGPPKDHPTEVAFSINASPTLNGNPNSIDLPTEHESVLEPSPYGVSLSAGDPYALTEKVASLFAFLQAQFPAMSPVEMAEDDEADLQRSPLEESTPGSYDDPTVVLTLPRTTAVAAEPVATPIAIKILQLRDDSLLRNSVYRLLDEDPATALRSTYIRDDDYLLRPGQFKFIPFAPIEPETRFVAVIGDYQNQENATWQQVLRIPPRGRQIILSVLVNDTQILLKEED
ncbi:type VI secretion system lipoprotein TssJ [Pseudomonas sp. P1B16]|uniref:type VI secretion system lipoprotein TssJ n=1 Tax=Pseudomonas TaxID=286 RepID=UPI000FA683E9|nr:MULTISPECIES: type VI secretion system lipoprotein TssJ [unclassified Pseudomonas]MBC3483378.1 type VI secretion system lipoprotein TssJ [Pseudomonas sp. SWRI77]MBC3503030.1 type VI secretion system lipoprotein TssJ [Pseudomonas sp. SWRI59]MBC3505824.1 type VI secretion system lipoprotein TssJ [Pseudomonas sp. SWRI68]UPL09239.1 type VI secretion lipoprotein family TssJ [Pseudomonas sp. IsoF]UVL02003.1 type VI secretion system lipoprotein TssJ [Pseudomonas sp. B21-047]